MNSRIEFTDIKSGTMYSSKEDFGLVIAKVSVGLAKVKAKSVDIPFTDGALDYTEFAGTPFYSNRKITIDCGFVITDRFAQESALRLALDGRKMKIRLSGDPDNYYVGRVEVSDMTKAVRVEKLKIVCDCEPFKYAVGEIEREFSLTSTSQSFIVWNRGVPVTPTVTADAPVKITVGGKTVDVAAGTGRVLDIKIPTGRNTLSARVTSGSAGTLILTYREMML